MNANQTQRNRRLQQAKLAAIPVLAIALGCVLYGNATSSPARPAVTPIAAPAAAAIDAKLPAPALSQAATVTKRPPRRLWPEVAIAEITAFDPFHPVPVSPVTLDTHNANNSHPANIPGKVLTRSKTADVTEKTPVQLTQKLRAVYRNGGKTVGILDDRIVHVGDVLKDGQRIVEFSADGITVEMP